MTTCTTVRCMHADNEPEYLTFYFQYFTHNHICVLNITKHLTSEICMSAITYVYACYTVFSVYYFDICLLYEMYLLETSSPWACLYSNFLSDGDVEGENLV